ncbi:hypothetical protein ABPG75_005317 [Micractinium tetrahymenae]
MAANEPQAAAPPAVPGPQVTPYTPVLMQDSIDSGKSQVTYIAGAALIVIVAVALIALSCAIKRRNRRRLAEIEESAARSAARRAARAEARKFSKQLALPVVILQPDGTCLLAAQEPQPPGGTQEAPGSAAPKAGTAAGAGSQSSRNDEAEEGVVVVVAA